MLKISHRGLLSGPDKNIENTPQQIKKALEAGFYAEVDVRLIGEQFWLGHDFAETPIDYDFLNNEKIFVHCKNLDAFTFFAFNDNPRHKCDFFAHENDPWVLTSKGYVWTFPRRATSTKSIIVDLLNEGYYRDIAGICSDCWI